MNNLNRRIAVVAGIAAIMTLGSRRSAMMPSERVYFKAEKPNEPHYREILGDANIRSGRKRKKGRKSR